MVCDKVQELLGSYFEWEQEDPRKKQIDEHVLTCEGCALEFAVWEESFAFLQQTTEATAPVDAAKNGSFMHFDDGSLKAFDTSLARGSLSGQVMERIYHDEPWKLPVADRIHKMSYAIRRNVTIAIALCLALFSASFLYLLLAGVFGIKIGSANQVEYGFHPTGSASGLENTLDIQKMKAAMESIGDGLIEPLKFNSSAYYPNYLLILSILGMLVTLLVMNWFSRMRN